jgi:predicted ATP-grasp superfamily ATP-dependent carboligase
VAFTEQGVAMLSSVLNSRRAIEVNVLIMRAFVRLRQMVVAHKDLLQKIEEMERKYDRQFLVVFEAIKKSMEPSEKAPKKMGFQLKENRSPYLATNRNR